MNSNPHPAINIPAYLRHDNSIPSRADTCQHLRRRGVPVVTRRIEPAPVIECHVPLYLCQQQEPRPFWKYEFYNYAWIGGLHVPLMVHKYRASPSDDRSPTAGFDQET